MIIRPALSLISAYLTKLRSGSAAALASLPMLLGLACPGASAQPAQPAETAIRAALEQWTADFNAGKTENICGLFALELRYDYRGYPERNFQDICRLLHHSLQDPTKKFTYALNIKEILVSDELAVVRLIWTLTIVSVTAPGSFEESNEPGMDIFRRQPDGNWKIIRFIAYQEAR